MLNVDTSRGESQGESTGTRFLSEEEIEEKHGVSSLDDEPGMPDSTLC